MAAGTLGVCGHDHLVQMAMLARGNELFLQNKSILDAAGDGIFGVDTSGTFTFANPAAVRMTGYSPEEFAGCNLYTLLHRTAAAPGATGVGGQQAPLQHGDHDVFRRKDGTSFPVEYSSSPIVVDGERPTGVVVVFRDISDRVEADRVKDQFTSVVSHELRTPLTSIRASLGLLESGVLGSLPDEARRMLQISVCNTDRLVRLIGDILDLERIEAGTIDLHHESCDGATLIACAVESVSAMATERAVALTVGAGSAALEADAERIIQTLTNLIGNAVKFSPRDSTVHICCRRRYDEVLFTVSDRGCGIPAHKLDTIFERFEQVDSSQSRGKGGTGLGLAICRSIVGQHGGRIWAFSTPGEGSMLSFVLPASRASGPGEVPQAGVYARPRQTPTENMCAPDSGAGVEVEQRVALLIGSPPQRRTEDHP